MLPVLRSDTWFLVGDGTTEALSKIWMPLEEFVSIVTKGLVAGTPYICAGRSEQMFDKYEKGKGEFVVGTYKAR